MSEELLGSGEFTIKPICSLRFCDEANNIVGALSWEKGVFTFEGNMEESARIFFEHFLKPCMEEELL